MLSLVLRCQEMFYHTIIYFFAGLFRVAIISHHWKYVVPIVDEGRLHISPTTCSLLELLAYSFFHSYNRVNEYFINYGQARNMLIKFSTASCKVPTCRRISWHVHINLMISQHNDLIVLYCLCFYLILKKAFGVCYSCKARLQSKRKL